MEQSTRIKKDEIPLGKLEKVGVTKDFVDRMEGNELKDFLNGFRSQNSTPSMPKSTMNSFVFRQNSVCINRKTGQLM
jgi:hypothetical protein